MKNRYACSALTKEGKVIELEISDYNLNFAILTFRSHLAKIKHYSPDLIGFNVHLIDGTGKSSK